MRDYLNSNEEKAKEYSNLKKQHDRIAYTQGKSKLIEEILESAKKQELLVCQNSVKYKKEKGYTLNEIIEILERTAYNTDK